MAKRVLVLHGPNVPLGLPAGQALAQLDQKLVARGAALGVEVRTFQANGEGALLDELLRQRGWAEAVVVNPGSLAPVAFGLADALQALGWPSVEVQLTHEAKGRGRSALRQVVSKQLHGQGVAGYDRALEALAGAGGRKPSAAAPARAKTLGAGRGRSASPPPRRAKTIGKKAAPVSEEAPRTGKSIGRRAPTGAPKGPAGKSLGRTRGTPTGVPAVHGGLSRASVRTKVADRLAGRLSAEALAAWARAQWLVVTSGGAAEQGQAALLEQVLLSVASPKAADDALLAAMAKLDA